MSAVGPAFALLLSAAPGGSMPKLEVQGHRGARAARPENTLAAFEHALALGVDTLELDLVVTRDDRLVIGHDPLLNPDLCLDPAGRRLDRPVKVRELSLAELQRYDCGSLRHPRFPRQQPVPKARMPALEELFALLASSRLPAARTVKLNLETKSVPGEPDLAPPPERFAALLVAALEKGGLLPRAVVQSFDHRTLTAARKLAPRLELAALTSDNLVDYVAVARAADARILSPDKQWITRAEVERLHAAGVRVIPWTANEEAEWKRLAEMGVDGIITDDPEGLLRWLGREVPRSAAEDSPGR